MPPLCKDGVKSDTSVKEINKRISWLQRFFDELLRDKVIRSLDIITFFFSLHDKERYEKMKKTMEKLATPKNISEIKHFEGKTTVSVTPEKVSLGKNLQRFANNAQGLYEKVMRANEDTTRVMQILITAFEHQAEAYKELAQAYVLIEVLYQTKNSLWK